MSNDLANKIAVIEQMRALIGDAAADAALAQLHSSPTPSASPSTLTPQVSMHIDAKESDVRHVKMVTAGVFIEASPADQADQAALKRYVMHLRGDCSTLPLATLDQSHAATKHGMQLDHVYIQLNTTTLDPQTPGNKEPSFLSALEVVQQHRHVMLLGAPGYGKSTFINHLVWGLSQRWLAQQDGKPAELTGWHQGTPIPIRVILREWAAILDLRNTAQGDEILLKQYLDHDCSRKGNVATTNVLWQHLHEGKAVLLLDGLDEVVGASLPIITATISKLIKTLKEAHIVITCRELDYRDEQLRQIDQTSVHTLAPLNEKQINSFIAAWYREYSQIRKQPITNAAAELARTIKQRVQLQPLAQSPLLLTVMAIVHASRGILPESRALLYKECIEILLLRWRQSEPGKVDFLERLAIPNFDGKTLLKLMARLGFVAHNNAAHEQTNSGPADLSKHQVLAILAEGLRAFVVNEEERDLAATKIWHAIKGGNGLLLQRGPEVYAFPHRTFQEFLAGYYIADQHNKKQLIRERASLTHWHEALQLMISFRVLESNDTEFPIDVVEMLLQHPTPLAQILAGELLLSIGYERLVQYYANEPTEALTLWQKVTSRMLELSTTSDTNLVAAAQRVRAGLAHGHLAFGNLATLMLPHPSFHVQDHRLPFAYLGTLHQQEPWWSSSIQKYWCLCKAGPFWFGNDIKVPLQQVSLDYKFYIARYPVTNAEYARFIAAGGYTTRRWWTKQGWHFLQPGGHPYDDQTQIVTQPRWWDDMHYNEPTQPVVAISWYEAMAYCAWLSEQLSLKIRLPTSLEYERAARHIDQRPYPWGIIVPTPEHANYNETNIDQPSPVGSFPMGNAVCGASDLQGNVREWLATEYESGRMAPPMKHADHSDGVFLSHGSFRDTAQELFCGVREGLYPVNWHVRLGFRVMYTVT